jgi:hypothetical protein
MHIPRIRTSSQEYQGKHVFFLPIPAPVVTLVNRSKSLGEIDIQQGLAYLPAALEQAQEHVAQPNNRSRSASGPLSPVLSHEAVNAADHDQRSIDAEAQEYATLVFNEAYEEINRSILEEASSPMTEQDNEDDEEEVENSRSPTTSDHSSLDHDDSLLSITTDPWSPSTPESPPSVYATSLILLPAPNNLTSTFLPFSSHLALTNHFNPSTLTHFQRSHTPISIHGMLQIPCTLSALLGIPTSDLLCHLTPAILLNHTTYLGATTLLHSLVQSTLTSTYHHTNGLLYFPKSALCLDKLDRFFVSQTPKVEMRKVTTQIQDSDGKRRDVVAWAWIAKAAEGTEEWWTCEDYIAGRVVGLESVEW